MYKYNLQFFGGRCASAGTFLSGQRYENEYSNVFILRNDSQSGTVRFIEGYSPSAIHDAQTLSQSDLRKYLKKYGFKMTGYYK